MAKEQPGLDQYAVDKFGAALEIIPRTLAENAGLKSEAIIADMYAKNKDECLFGIDVNDGKVKDVVEARILDSIETKSWALKLCFDVVITILKVDSIIMAKPSGGPSMADRAARRPDGYDE